jgi:hypothetical protein
MDQRLIPLPEGLIMIDKNFPVTGPINLVVRVGHGSVVVTARDDAQEAVVRLTPRVSDSDIAERTSIEFHGGTLTLMAPRQGGLSDLFGRRRDRDCVDVEIELPARSPMKITTATADIRVIGRSGDADLVTGSAGIDVDRVEGSLRLRSGSATSRVAAVSGDVVSRFGSGSVTLGDVGGSIQSGFGSGDLAVETAHGSVRSRAGSGDAHIGAAWGDVDFTAGSGQVSVGLPEGVSARLDVTSGSGRVRSELPIEDSPRPGKKSITVRARTGSGEIRLFRAGQAA